MNISFRALKVLRQDASSRQALGWRSMNSSSEMDLVPGLPRGALDDLNWVAGYWLDRLLQAAGLADSATAGWALISVSDYALAILLLAGAAIALL